MKPALSSPAHSSSGTSSPLGSTGSVDTAPPALVAWYVNLAWQDGDMKLQAGWWPYIGKRLDELDLEFMGIRAEVLGRLKELRNEPNLHRRPDDRPA